VCVRHCEREVGNEEGHHRRGHREWIRLCANRIRGSGESGPVVDATAADAVATLMSDGYAVQFNGRAQFGWPYSSNQ
jgi:hypothetical protein